MAVNMSWDSNQVELLASAMMTINREVSSKVETLQKDIKYFESEEAFGTPGGGEPSQHMDILGEFFKVLQDGITTVAQNTEQINKNINAVLEVAKIGIKTNFKNSEEAKNALVANKNKAKA